MAKKRSELQKEQTWNIEALYPSFKAWQQDFESISNDTCLFEKIRGFKGKLSQGPKTLKELLDFTTNLERRLEKLFVYAHLKHDEDVSDPVYKEAFDTIMFFFSKYQTEISWIQPEILSLSEDIFKKYLSDNVLDLYHLHLKQILRLKQHTLSEKEEKLMALSFKSLSTARSAFGIFNNVDLKFPEIVDSNNKKHELTHSLYSLYMQSQDRTLRKNAFEAIHKGFQNFENTVCELLQGHVQTHVFNTKARGYKSCMEQSLYVNEIDPNVYLMLLKSAEENIHSLHKYIKLRKDLLGLDKIHAYDMYVPCFDKFKYSFSYEEAKNIVIEAVAPLGKEYQETLKKGLNEQRWVDPFENESKRSGAYSSGCYDGFPYILMNFQGTLSDLMTLAHEAGHSMHTHYSVKNQPYIYSQYVIFVAEVASTFNEELVFRYLLNKATSEEEKFYLIQQKIDGIRATFFRQALFAEFELELHKLGEKQQPINPTILKSLYKELNKKYHGESFEVDDFLACEFLRIPHFYSNFYVYQYSTGIAAALSLVEDVLSKKDPKKYLNFLASGCSKDPVTLLKDAGVDMTKKHPTELLCKKFESLTGELEELSKRISGK